MESKYIRECADKVRGWGDSVVCERNGRRYIRWQLLQARFDYMSRDSAQCVVALLESEGYPGK